MSFFYKILLWVFFILSLPGLIVEVIKGNRLEIRERLGFLPQNFCNIIKGETVLWIHGVSVGETVAAAPLCTELRKLFPQYKMVFSTVTKTGQEMAKKTIKADAFFYFPVDFPWVVKRVLRLIRPKLVIFMETELWPNFIKTASQSGCKLVLANGRISDRSARRYKLIPSSMKKMLGQIDALIMQSPHDVNYILDLGAEERKVFYFGNTKYDLNSNDLTPAFKKDLAREMQIEDSFPILVVGSTHENEEEVMMPVYEKLKAEYPDLVMIIAPRHLDRINDLQNLYEKAGISTVRRRELKNKKRNDSVIFLDTIGELFSVYSLADLVFIGGTFAAIGGHNILEPAAYGKVIFVGPYMFNFKAILKVFLEQDACIQVQNPEELTEKMLTCLKNTEKSRIKGFNALKIIKENQGAAQKSSALVAELIRD